MNKVIIVGRTVRDCTFYEKTTERKCCKFVIASKGDYYDGEELHTDFIKCVAWDKVAETLVRYIHKGDLISVWGIINTRTYEVEGKKQYTQDIIVQKVELLSRNEKPSDTDTNLPF